MVMLYLFKDDPDAVVAHFNHGTRPSSDADEIFCSRQAAIYHRPFYSTKVALGSNVSEEKARAARYGFLNDLKRELRGEIYTAHHADDLIESIAINLLRGTGWRGLTPLSANYHPLLSWHKKDIYKYAAEHNITFRQDPTNTEDYYLRNRLRPQIKGFNPFIKKNVLSLWAKQEKIRKEIDETIAKSLSADNTYNRDYLKNFPDQLAIEILRAALLKINIKTTRPQLADFLSAIHTYQPNKKFNLPNKRFAKITRKDIQL